MDISSFNLLFSIGIGELKIGKEVFILYSKEWFEVNF